MKNYNRITENIEVLREKLLYLIQTKEDLLDPEVVQTSKLLDKALDEYNSVIFTGFKFKRNRIVSILKYRRAKQLS